LLLILCGPLAGPAQAADFENPVPVNPPGEVFPPPYNEQTFSIGVFRLIIDTNAPWFNAALLTGYPGYNPTRFTLTSPMCFDSATAIGRSRAYQHGNPSLSFGVPVGHTPSTISKVSDYPAIPSFFLSPSATFGTRKLYTEIRSLLLVNSGDGTVCSNNPLYEIPSGFGGGLPFVKAGSLNGLPVSRGQVQSYSPTGVPANDFPAQSFFDVFVEAMLPMFGPWPATAFLTNGEPLIVQNTNVVGLPPTVVYIHEQTAAVPVYFRNTAGPWVAGQRFGWLILAGHGVQFDCSNAGQVNSMLQAVFGPGNSNPGLPVARDDFYGRDICPPPLAVYVSPINGRTNIFTNGLRIRKIRHSNLTNPIPLPLPGNTANYSANNTLIQFEFSTDGGGTWSNASASASVAITITAQTNSGPTRIFDTEMLQLNASGGSLPPGFMLRESPTLASRGRTTDRPVNGGFRISSFFNVMLEMSTDNGNTWSVADSPATVVLSTPNSYAVLVPPGNSLIANQLNHGNNNINIIMPQVPDGTAFFKWNNALNAFETAQMFDSAFGLWVDSGTGNPSTTTLSPGEVAAIQNPMAAPFSITFTGTLKEPDLPRPLLAGQTYGYSQQTPTEGTYDSITGRLPGEQSQLLRFNPTTQAYDAYTYSGGLWSPSNPIVSIGEGVFIKAITNSQACLKIFCPSNIVATSANNGPVNVSYTVGIANYCGTAPVTLTCNPPSPGPFPVGITTVVCTASAGPGFSTSCQFTVTVLSSPSNSVIPVLHVVQSGATAAQASALANQMNIPSSMLSVINGEVSFIDPVNFLAVPTSPTSDPSNLVASTENEFPQIPISLRQLNFPALSNIVVLDPNLARSSFSNALASSGLTPQFGSATIDHTMLTAFYTNPGNGVISNSAALDTSVNYQFASGAMPIIGPGAQVQIDYGSNTTPTRLLYATRQYSPGQPVQVISPSEAVRRVASRFPGMNLQITPQLVYYSPALSYGSVSNIIPYYSYTATATITNPSTGQTSPMNLFTGPIPATDDAFVPSAYLSVNTPGGTQVVASVQAAGGQPPYTYLWSGSPPSVASNTGPTVVYTPVVRLSPPALDIEVGPNRTVVISWQSDPADIGSYSLESTPNIIPTAWTPVSPQPNCDASGRCSITLSASAQSLYFRLRYLGSSVASTENVNVIVTDANGIEVTASQSVQVQATPTQSMRGDGPGTRVGGVTDWGTESPVYGGGFGLANKDTQDWWNGMRTPGHGGGVERYAWLDTLSWRRDFIEEPYPGLDNLWVDNADITFYVGHGNPDVITFSGAVPLNHNPMFYNQADHAWGDEDQEWMCFLSCEVLAFKDGANVPIWSRWTRPFDGLHILTGFWTLAGARTGFPRTFSDLMLAGPLPVPPFPAAPLPIVNSWLAAAHARGTGGSAALGPIGPAGVWDYGDYYWGKGPVGPDIRWWQVTGWWYISRAP
jgi:hypothetical protein